MCVCVFRNANFILIDDGFYTMVAYEKYLKRGYYLPIDNYKGIRGYILRLLYFGSDYKRLVKDKINIFTFYYDYFTKTDILV